MDLAKHNILAFALKRRVVERKAVGSERRTRKALDPVIWKLIKKSLMMQW